MLVNISLSPLRRKVRDSGADHIQYGSWPWSPVMPTLNMSLLPWKTAFLSVQFSLQSCSTLCYPMDCIMPGFPVHHQLLDFTQTHIHQVGDGIQPTNPLLSPSPLPSIFPSPGVNSSHQVDKVMEFQLQSFQWIFRTLGWTAWISLLSKGLSNLFSNTTVQKHQFFGTQLSL